MKRVRYLFLLMFNLIYLTLLAQNEGEILEDRPPAPIIDTTQQKKLPDRKWLRAFTFKTENDFFGSFIGLKNGDKDYTGGFQLEFYTDYLKGGIFPFFMNRAKRKSNTRNLNTVYFAGLGFTPARDFFSEKGPVKTERPYASLLLIGRKRIAVFVFDSTHCLGNREFSILTDFYTGVIGSQGVGNAQNWIHRNITNSNEVMGWHNQIANGGRFVYNYIFNPTLGLLKQHSAKGANLYASPHLSVGNIHKNAGMRLSLSNLRLSSQPIIHSMNSAMAADNSTKTDNGAGDKFDSPSLEQCFLKRIKYDLYVKTTRVFHNSLLNGMPIKRYDSSIYTIDKINTEDFLTDIGLRLYYPYLPYKKRQNSNLSDLGRITTVYVEVIHRTKEFSFGPQHTFLGVGVQILNLD